MFKAIYFVGFAAMLVIRLRHRWLNRTNQIAESRRDVLEMALLAQAFIGMAVLPQIYVFTTKLDFADYDLLTRAGWLGTGAFVLALWLLWRSHADLGRNWFQTLELRLGHELVTDGVFKRVRHPMYAAFFLWGLAQPLLLHNWVAGWSHLASFTLLYLFRVRREERMMLGRFGEEYREYMSRTGRLIPPLP